MCLEISMVDIFNRRRRRRSWLCMAGFVPFMMLGGEFACGQCIHIGERQAVHAGRNLVLSVRGARGGCGNRR